jgi:hypothetical protein
MGKTMITYSFRIPTILICGIEYGGFDGLNDADIKAIHDFWNECDELAKKNGKKSYSIDYSEESYFGIYDSPFSQIAYCGDVTDATVTII